MDLDVTKRAYNDVPISDRKKLGQYFTPLELAKELCSLIPAYSGDKILDPAVGTGQLLYPLLGAGAGLELEGWDIDPRMVNYARETLGEGPEIVLKSALEHNTNSDMYDVVVMNPPYFQIKQPHGYGEEYDTVIAGRPNIFSFFIKKAIDITKPEGYIGAIVPPSMNNGAYFKPLREYVIKHTNVEHLIIKPSTHFKHAQAQTETQLLVLKKTVNTGEHIFTKNGHTIFTQNSNTLEKEWVGAKSLEDIGYEVKTGNVVWNQHKTDFVNAGIPLIYATDINQDGTITLKDKQYRFLPPQEQLGKPATQQPTIVANRIVGTTGSRKIKASVLEGVNYVENHVNTITPTSSSTIPLDAVVEALRHISGEYLDALTGNTQLSSKELLHMIPLHV